MSDKKIGNLIYGAVLNTKNFIKGSKDVVNATKKTNTAVKKSSDGVGKLNKNLKKTGKNAGFMSGQMKKLRVQLLAAAGTAAFLKFLSSASKEAFRFEKGMIRINTVTQLSKKELDKLADGLVNLSKKMAIPLEDLQNGLFDVASAGIEASKQLDFLTAAAAFAAVGQFKVETAVKGLTAILKGYGAGLADTERIMNLFLQTNVKGQTTLEDLSVAVQGIAGIANNAGVEMEEFFAILATGTGVTGNAKEVATQLRGAINAIAAPTQESSKRFKELGIEVGKSAIKEKGFVAVAKEIFDSVNGDSEALRKLIPEVEAMTLVIALSTTQNEKFNENLEQNQKELNLTAKQYKEFADSASGRLIVAGNAWTNFVRGTGQNLLKLFLILDESSRRIALFARLARKNLSAFFELDVADDFNKKAKKIQDSAIKISKSLEFKESESVRIKVRQDLKTAQNLFDRAGNFANAAQGDIEGMNEEIRDFAKGSTKRLKDALESLANANQKFGSETGKAANKVKDLTNEEKKSIDTTKEAEKAISELGKEYDTWQKGIEKTEKKLEDLGKKNEKIMNDIRDSISEVTNEIGNLEGAFAEDIASEVVDAEKKLSDLQSDLGQADLSNERIESLKEEIKLQKELIATGNKLIEDGTLSEEDLAEARRKASLNSIDAKAEEFEAEKAVLEEREELLRKLDEGEEIALDEVKDRKNRILIEELQTRQDQVNAEIGLVQDEQLAIQNAWIEGARAIELINDDLIARLDSKYIALAGRIRSALSSSSGGAEGGGQMGGQFQGGGHTGPGQTNAPAGVVHAGEWVANARFVRDNKNLIKALDHSQRKGFQGGGNVENSHNRSVTINPTVNHRVGLRAVMKEARYHLR